MAIKTFFLVGTKDFILRAKMTIRAFRLGFRHNVFGDLVAVEGAPLIECFLDLMASGAVLGRILMVTDSAALFISDEFAMFSDIRVADIALDFLFEKMTFMGEIQAEYLFFDFLNSRMAARALSR